MHRDRTISAAVTAYGEALPIGRTRDRHSPEDGIGIGIGLGIAAAIPACTGDPATGGSGKSREGCF